MVLTQWPHSCCHIAWKLYKSSVSPFIFIHFLIFPIQINFQPVTRLRLHLFLWINTSSCTISSIDDVVNSGSMSHLWVCALNHFENTIILKTYQRAGTWHKHIQFHSHSTLLPLGRINFDSNLLPHKTTQTNMIDDHQYQYLVVNLCIM